MVNKALDSVLGIAAGIIEPSAIILEKAMKAATPAIIGFLGEPGRPRRHYRRLKSAGSSSTNSAPKWTTPF